MIAPLHPLLDDRDVARARRRAASRDDVGERRLADVVRAAAGDQDPAGLEQLQRAQVDFLVAGERLGAPPPCSSRTPAGRARSCRTARRARSSSRSSSNTFIARASTFVDAVARGVLRECARPRPRRCRPRAPRRTRRERQREPAVVAEAVEQPSARVARGRLAVLALIEKQPGLLPAPRIDLVARRRPRAPSMDSGTVAVQHLDPLLEPFEQRGPADRCARGCRPAAAARPSDVDDLPAAGDRCPATAPAPPGSRRSDRRSATAADRASPWTRRYAVASMRSDRAKAQSPPRSARAMSVDRRRLVRRASACAARSPIDRCRARSRAAARAAAAHGRCRRPPASTLDDVAAIDPRMAAAQPLFAARRDDDSRDP